jgi:hypothetical protein
VGVCSGVVGFAASGAGIGGRPMRLERAGLGVVVRVPGARSVCADAADVCCGKLTKGCDFASFLNSFCARPSSVNKSGDRR